MADRRRDLGGGLLIAWFTVAAAAPCESLVDLVQQSEQAVLEGRLEDCAELLARAEQALACGEPADRDVLVRLWLTEGASAVFAEDAAAASDAFEAAHRTDPESWTADFGPDLRSAYDAAVPSEGPGGTLTLEPAVTLWRARLDGRRVEFPVQASAGLHVVQVHPEGGEVGFGQAVMLLPGQNLILRTHLIETAPEPAAPAVIIQPLPVVQVVEVKRRSRTWLAVGGVAAGLAGASAGLYVLQNEAMRNAESANELDAARDRQRGLSAAGAGLGVISAVAFTVHLTR